MKAQHSDSLILIWRLAELEARNVKASTIEPAHLFLGLCKSVDIDLTTIVSKESTNRDEMIEEFLREVRRVRTIFRAVGLDARTFRRALRRKCVVDRCVGDRIAPSETKSLHRSQAAKQIFADAEQIAEIGNSVVFPVHLLSAAIATKDDVRDDLMKQSGVEPARLKKTAMHEAMFAGRSKKPSVGLN